MPRFGDYSAVARALGFTPAGISRFMGGHGGSWKMAEAIAGYLNLPRAYVFFGSSGTPELDAIAAAVYGWPDDGQPRLYDPGLLLERVRELVQRDALRQDDP